MFELHHSDQIGEKLPLGVICEMARDLINTGDCEGPECAPTDRMVWRGCHLLIIGAGTSADRLFGQNKFLEYFVGEQSPAGRQADKFSLSSISPSSTNSAIVRRTF